MSRKQQPFVSVTGGPPRGGDTPRALDATLDRFLGIQRPAVVAHLRALRRRHPEASAAELAAMLERRYLTAVTTGGAAVGATAVIPAIGTGVTLALSGLETAGFLESTALYAQSLSELHGIAVDDPTRARALVLTMMLGREGSDLVRQFGGQLTGASVTRTAYWGELVTSTLPSMAVGPLVDRLRGAFLRQFAVRGGASIVARAIPFGIGAVIGGTGNHILGRRVVLNSRMAFGPAPMQIPAVLAPGDGPGAVRRLGAAAGGGVLRAGRLVRAALPELRRGNPTTAAAIEAPAGEAPAGETPANEASADKVQADKAPAHEAPANKTPTNETPGDEAPAGDEGPGAPDGRSEPGRSGEPAER